MLCAIKGGTSTLVGRSHECDNPLASLAAPVTSGKYDHHQYSAKEVDRLVKESMQKGEPLYHLNEKLIRELKPDIIITQDLCAVCSIDLPAVECLAAKLDHVPEILSLNPHTLSEVMDSILEIGKAVNLEMESRELYESLHKRISHIASLPKAFEPG